MDLAEELRIRILDIPDVEERPSRFGGRPAFFHSGREIAHSHGGACLDIRLTKRLVRELADGVGARVVPRRSPSDWLEVEARTEREVAEVVALVKRAVEANRRGRG
jgi:hypothetical protein